MKHKKIAFLNHRGYADPGHLVSIMEGLGYGWEMLAREDLPGGVVDPGQYAAIFSLGSWRDPNPADPEVGAELEFMHRAISKQVPVVGICFGAELLALHDGGKVFRLSQPMVGYYPVILKGSLRLSSEHFFWNSFGFSAPKDSEVLASGPESCLAYHTKYTLALQFHIDATAGLLQKWTADPVGAAKLIKCGISKDRIVSDAGKYAPQVIQEATRLLRSFFASEIVSHNHK